MTHITFPSWLTSAQSIAIVGFGREGKSTLKFLQKHFPTARIRIIDEREDIDKKDVTDVKYMLGNDAFLGIPAVSCLFKSPGIPLKKLRIPEGTYVTSQTDLFIQLFGKQTIAVTGTKGKSTTAHVINHVLSHTGHKSLLVGNIGKPALDFVQEITDDTHIVYEMSAFQAESLHAASHIAVFTSLFQDHLDYYNSMHEYKTAKKRLFELQTADDVCIFCDDFPEIADLLQECQAQKIPYSSSSSSLPINYQPAQIIATKLFGIGEENVTDALATVQSLPGRLEKVGTYSDITFYDDALATIPEATMLALDMLGDDVETLIVGGHERGQNFDTLAKKIAQSSVQTLITLSPTGKRIGETVHDLADRKIHIFAANSMEEIIHLAFDHTANGKIVLLSTAAPSFGIFKDYTDRSEQYRTWIETLSKTA